MDSIRLYKKLLESSRERLLEFTKNFPRQEKQFTFEKFNEIAFEKMYKNLKEVVQRQQLFSEVPGLKEACKGCWSFYLDKRNESVKSLDTKLGKQFEKALEEFFISIGLECIQSDERGLEKNYPDLVVLGQDEKPVAFLEVKYLTAPFVTIFRNVQGRECYEGSTTLDADKKLEAQRKIVEEKIDVPVYYVYWIDYPCIKGIFSMSAEEVFAYVDKVKREWTRKEREGNFIHVKGKRVKVGHTEKVYLPLLNMGDFEGLVRELHRIFENSKKIQSDKKNLRKAC